MQYRIKITELPLFNYVSPSFSKELVKTFTIIKKKKDDIILKYGEEVSGLYLLVEGEIDVIARTSDIYITTLDKGSTFGEMSLLENETSSATLKAKTDVVMLLCNKDEFNRLLQENFVFAAAFYRGAAKILSKRLRDTNLKVESEMDKGRVVIHDMVKEKGILYKIGHTQYSINDTGESLITKLTNLLPIMDKLASEIPDKAVELKELKASIKNVITVDSQNFDIISQQMDQINQHLTNIHRSINGLDNNSVKGDAKIFDIQKTRDAEDEDAITFF